jgi:hypothetical protein
MKISVSSVLPLPVALFVFVVCSCTSSVNTETPKTGKKKVGPGRIIATGDFSSTGCFHHYTGKLLLIQSGGNTFALMEIRENSPVEKELTKAQVISFDNFFKELKYLKEKDNCTTIDTYKVSYQNKTIKKSDGGCGWNGFYNLYRDLFNSDYISAFN